MKTGVIGVITGIGRCLQAVSGEMSKLEQQRAAGKEQLDQMLQEMTLDATI